MKKRVILGNTYDVKVDELQDAYSVEGEQSSKEGDNVVRSVEQKEEQDISRGTIVNEAFNHGLNAFHPDIMFENLVNNYSMAEKIYGETLIRLLSGYEPSFVERNITIPEFKRELKKKLEDSIKELKEDKILDREGNISEEGIEKASLVLCMQELDSLNPHGSFGEKLHKSLSHYGERQDHRKYKRGDRYKDLDLKKSLKQAIRRMHKTIEQDDLKTSQRQKRGKVQILYALDASGSMKGKKIDMAKKAGIALAYKAIQGKDDVGVLVFGSEIKAEIPPTQDFMRIVKLITQVRATRQTDFKAMLKRSGELFSHKKGTNHLIVLTDAMPTVGKDPEEETLEEISKLQSQGITVSLIGINLDNKAQEFAKKVTQRGNGKLYLVKQLDEIDTIMLMEYQRLV